MICKKCAHESYCDMAQFGGHKPPITACSKFKEKSQTNADRIRSMSDEELATRIKCPKTTPCIHLEDDYPCVNCKLDWLREEYE